MKENMKKICYIFGCFLAAFLFMAAVKPISAFAATASFHVSSDTVTQGGLVTVTVSVSADAGIGGYQCAVVYDSDKLEWVTDANLGGGGGRITYVEYNADGAKQDSFTIQFRALAVGTASVSVENSSYLQAFDTNLNDLSVSAGSGSIKITAPAVASGNCNLQSLSLYGVDEKGDTKAVSFTPGFSSGVTEYNANVSYDILYYAVQASAEDKNAAVYTSGVDLSEGTNTTVITVEAENGDTKTYYIYTRKAEKPPVDNSMLEVTVGGTAYVIQRDFDDSVLPEGFEKSTLVYKEQTVECGVSLNKEMTVLYLQKADGTGGKLFGYEADGNALKAFVQLGMKQKTYTILEKEPDSVPEGFEKKEVTVAGNKVSLWQRGDFCLIYAFNQDGAKSWYLYDVKELTVQRFDASLFGLESVTVDKEADTQMTEPSEETAATATDAGNWYNRYKEIREKQKQERKIWTAVTIALSAAAIVCIVITAAVIVKRRKKKGDSLDGEWSDEELLNVNPEKEDDEKAESGEEKTGAPSVPESIFKPETAEGSAGMTELEEEIDEGSIESAMEQLVSDVMVESEEEAVPEEKKQTNFSKKETGTSKEKIENKPDDSLDSFEIF